MAALVVGILAAIFSFGLIVFVHEMGHFLTARWAGIHCPQFAIGFGPKLYAFRWRGTEFSLRAFPLGGYVMMDGEDPAQDYEDGWLRKFETAVGRPAYPTTPAQVLANMEQPDPEVEEFLQSLPAHRVYQNQADLAGNFNAKSTLQRTVVILGGVTMNYVCAFLLLVGLGFTKGLPAFEKPATAKVGSVVPGGVAEAAGVKSGETIVALDGNPVVNGEDFINQVRNKAGKKVRLSLSTGKASRDLTMTPELSLANAYYASQQEGHIELTRVSESVKPPSGSKLPWRIDRVDGKPLGSLDELSKLTASTAKVQLEGPQGKWEISSPSSDFAPRGVVGIAMESLLSLGFEGQATSKVLNVTPNTAAARAGVQPGDVLLGIHNAQTEMGKRQIEAALEKLSQRPLNPGSSIALVVLRNEKLVDLKIQEVPPATAEAFGVQLEKVTTSVIFEHSVGHITRIMTLPFTILGEFRAKPKEAAKELAQNTSGPLGIMQTISEASAQGFPALLLLVAILNAFIATFNLLPIPALDGSRCMFIWLGAIRGRAIDPEKEARIHFIGIVVLLSIVFVVSLHDVYRIAIGASFLK